MNSSLEQPSPSYRHTGISKTVLVVPVMFFIIAPVLIAALFFFVTNGLGFISFAVVSLIGLLWLVTALMRLATNKLLVRSDALQLQTGIAGKEGGLFLWSEILSVTSGPTSSGVLVIETRTGESFSFGPMEKPEEWKKRIDVFLLPMSQPSPL